QARFNALTGSNQIGLQPAIAGWTTTRKETHAVGMRAVTVRRADCDHAVSIAGIGNAESRVTFVGAVLRFEPLIAEIACCGNYDNSAFHESLTFVADRSASTGEVAYVVWNRKTEVRAVNTQICMTIV